MAGQGLQGRGVVNGVGVRPGGGHCKMRRQGRLDRLEAATGTAIAE